MSTAARGQDQRTNLPVALTTEARAVVEQVKAETGIAKQIAVQRILEWFTQQHPDVRKAILYGHDAAAEMVKLRKAELTEPDSLEGAQAAADEAVQRLVRIAREATNAARAAAKKK